MPIILHPRPSPIAAAMYMLRDLDVDLIVIHGPSGCCFGPARLLERDGVKIITTAMSERDLIFGGEGKLIEVLKKVDDIFNPKLMGIIGTCASMIIGEDLKRAAMEAGVINKSICCNIHSGYGDNTIGAIMVLKEAMNLGIIEKGEYERQKQLLEMATLLEKTRGSARDEYMGNYAGDNPNEVAYEILNTLKKGGKIACILNAKKETAFVYADIFLALSHFKDGISFLANLNPNIGLPRIRSYSQYLIKELKSYGIEIELITGGLDEYPIAGKKAEDWLIKNNPDLAIIAGIPHAIAIEGKIKTIAVSAGTRASFNLKKLGYDYVVNEQHAHRISLGEKKIHKSILGRAIRRLVKREIS